MFISLRKDKALPDARRISSASFQMSIQCECWKKLTIQSEWNNISKKWFRFHDVSFHRRSKTRKQTQNRPRNTNKSRKYVWRLQRSLTFRCNCDFRSEATKKTKNVLRSDSESVCSFCHQPSNFVLYHLPVSWITDRESFVGPVSVGRRVLHGEYLRWGTAGFGSPL